MKFLGKKRPPPYGAVIREWPDCLMRPPVVKLQEISGKIHKKFLDSVTPTTDWEALLKQDARFGKKRAKPRWEGPKS